MKEKCEKDKAFAGELKVAAIFEFIFPFEKGGLRGIL
jgi:hypothetical protein